MRASEATALRDVLIAINEAAFPPPHAQPGSCGLASSLPVILSLEMHCSIAQQETPPMSDE